MSSGGRTSSVSLRRYPLWRLRAGRELPRYALIAAAAAGLLASARFAIAPPRATPVAAPAGRAAAVDLAAQGYATLFARHYLTWDARRPERVVQELEPFSGAGLDPAAGFVPPVEGEERVDWAEVVQDREPTPGRHVYTVAAQARPGGLVYLSVGVARTAEGKLALTGYPAFVGPPSSRSALPAGGLRPLDPRGATEEDCSSTVNFLLYRAGLRPIRDILRLNPLAQDYIGWGLPGPGRWVTIYATVRPTPHVFAVIAGLRIDTSHAGTDVGPNRAQDGPRWRIFGAIPGWAHWSVRHPPGL